jgi:uncharacterized protein (DUF58 family)
MYQVEQDLAKLQSNGVSVDMPELLRYKTLAHMLAIAPSSRSASQLAGGERSLFKGRGMEFDEARHYQPGDDIRSIDWRVTARTGKTHTKIFREERERPVFVFVDMTSTMHFGTQLLYKSVQAAHMAALISWAAVGRGDKLGGIVFNEHDDIECKPRAQTKNALHYLNSLARLQTETSQRTQPATPGNQALLKALQRMHYLAKPGSLIHILSDAYGIEQAHLSLIGDISRHCEVKFTLIQDPFEQALPHSGSSQILSVTDGVNRGSLVLGDDNQATRYQLDQMARLTRLKQDLSKARVQPRIVSAGQVLDEQLVARNRGFEMGTAL